MSDFGGDDVDELDADQTDADCDEGFSYMYNQPSQDASNDEYRKEEIVLPSTEMDKHQENLSYPTNLSDIRRIALARYVTLTPEFLNTCILDCSVTTKVVPFLLIVCGLPDNATIERLLQNIIPEMSYKYTSKTETPLCVGQFAGLAVRNTSTDEIFFQQYKMNKGFILLVQSALEKNIRLKGKGIFGGTKSFIEKFCPFSSDLLNQHFKFVFNNLCDFNNQKLSGHTEWEEHLTDGLSMVNIWYTGFGKVASCVLPAFAHHLTNSFVWMFLGEVDKLYDPPDNSINDKEFITNWRVRINYLLRLAKLVSSHNNRSNMCHIVASISSSSATEDITISKIIEQLKEKVKFAAKLMQVPLPLISTEDTCIAFRELDDKCVKKFETLLRDMIKRQLSNLCEIPLSFLFLFGSIYESMNTLYIEKMELMKIAENLNISNVEFENFCQFAASFGTIIDLSLFEESCQTIILKPLRFLNELEKLFNCQSDDHPLVSQYGVVTSSAAEKIFGSKDALVYMEFFKAVKLAVELPCTQFGQKLDDPYAYYIPNTCSLPPEFKCSPTSLHWLCDSTKSISNLNVLFATEYLELFPNSKLEMSSAQPSNITLIRSFPAASAPYGILFHLIYFEDIIEFNFPSDDVNEEVCQQILTACNRVLGHLPKDIKYNFAIMCQTSDTDESCNLQKQLHLLPLRNNLTPCEKCSITSAVKIWSALLQQENFRVPVEQQLYKGTVCHMHAWLYLIIHLYLY
jgi:hypothetical protein